MEDKTQSQKTIINVLYFMIVLSTILSFVPYTIGQLLSLTLIVVALIGAYIYRTRDREDGLLYNHMTYMIGTIWIGTSFILLGCMIMGLWVYVSGDQSVIMRAITQLEAGGMITEEQLTEYMNQYIISNQSLLIKASLIALGPAILYFVYRVANGIARAGKGYRIANPKSWL